MRVRVREKGGVGEGEGARDRRVGERKRRRRSIFYHCVLSLISIVWSVSCLSYITMKTSNNTHTRDECKFTLYTMVLK